MRDYRLYHERIITKAWEIISIYSLEHWFNLSEKNTNWCKRLSDYRLHHKRTITKDWETKSIQSFEHWLNLLKQGVNQIIENYILT